MDSLPFDRETIDIFRRNIPDFDDYHYSASEVAELFGVTRQLVHRWARTDGKAGLILRSLGLPRKDGVIVRVYRVEDLVQFSKSTRTPFARPTPEISELLITTSLIIPTGGA